MIYLGQVTNLANAALIAAIIVGIGGFMLIARQYDPRRTLALITLIASIPLLMGVGYYLNFVLPNLSGIKLDQYAYRADFVFGEPSYVLGRFLVLHTRVYFPTAVAYFSLQGALSLTVAAYVLTSSYSEGVRCIKIFVLNLSCATPFYLVFPVVGPAHAFAGFPWAMPSVNVAHVVSLYGIPNGMPSVHTSTAILIVYFARRSKICTVLASVYLALIVVGTLGSGEHYLVDLFAAVPYSAFIVWLGDKLAFRKPVQILDATLERRLTWQRSQQ